MDFNIVLVVIVIAIALLFDYTNGFHDAANAIATSVSTRALKPRTALAMAAVMNVIGALMGTEVAKTIGEGIIDINSYALSDSTETQRFGLIVVLSALVGAVVWNYTTWWFGLPSSSSHALIGGLAGAGIASATQVHWTGILNHVIIPMISSPIIGFVLSYFAMKLILAWFANRPYHKTMGRFRHAQTLSAAAMALGHGLQDAQKTMGVIVMALLAGGYGETHNIFDEATGDMTIPLWVKLAAAAAISLGTYSGGYKIMKTLGSKMIDLDPARGFVAETVSASILYTAAYLLHAPISTTQTITASILGVGATKRLSAVRWSVTGNIVVAWVLTLPAAATVAAIMFFIFHAIIPVY
ncbi:inorganic phosphate transporter [Actinomycetaceae bacterium MB13-C1-2]|nr:inorganic phosphate transporter [Actinomycetaceae bacterium MB13-C1-2]